MGSCEKCGRTLNPGESLRAIEVKVGESRGGYTGWAGGIFVGSERTDHYARLQVCPGCYKEWKKADDISNMIVAAFFLLLGLLAYWLVRG